MICHNYICMKNVKRENFPKCDAWYTHTITRTFIYIITLRKGFEPRSQTDEQFRIFRTLMQNIEAYCLNFSSNWICLYPVHILIFKAV